MASRLPLNIAAMLNKRCVEPQKRMCAGRYGWVIHRFPIKGGLPLRSIWLGMLIETAARESFFTRMMAAKPKADGPIVRVDLRSGT